MAAADDAGGPVRWVGSWGAGCGPASIILNSIGDGGGFAQTTAGGPGGGAEGTLSMLLRIGGPDGGPLTSVLKGGGGGGSFTRAGS